MDDSWSAHGGLRGGGSSRMLFSPPRGGRGGAASLVPGSPEQPPVSSRSSRLSSPSPRKDGDESSDDGGGEGFLADCREHLLGAGVRTLRRSYFLGGLALWHTYGIWTAACIDIAVGLVLLIRWYVGWLSFAMRSCKGNEAAGFSCNLHFFATFCRSYLLIAFTSEVARFCFWLARDAWRMDAFEAYRRTLSGQARPEMELGSLYSVGWSPRFLESGLRVWDAAVQCMIFISFDVVPPLCAVIAFSSPDGGLSRATSALFQALAVVSCIHVAVFFVAWTATDVWIKVTGFRMALRGETKFSLDAQEILKDVMMQEAEEAESCDEQDALLAASAMEAHASQALRAAARCGSHAKAQRLGPADWLNLCVPIRTAVHMAAPLLGGPVVIAAGIALGRPSLVFGGLALIPLLVAYSYAKLRHSRNAAQSIPRFLDSESRVLWALQSWGETCCGLEYQEQMKRRVSFAKIVLLQALMFAFFSWWSYMAVCTAILLGVIVKQVCLYSERPWGWLVGIAEGLLAAICVAVLSLAFPTTPHWRTLGPSFGLLLLAGARQFGLARENPDSYRLAHAVSLGLSLATLLVSAVVLFSQMTYDTSSYDMLGTSFCNASSPDCAYYSVPYISPKDTHKLTCPAWFNVGERGQKFSLGDFGLLSAVAYESEATMPRALQHYFPGWRVVCSHWESQSMKDHSADWTTFFEYASPNNQTSVFAIRGTHTAIDALNDIIIWAPSVVFQGFGLLGPNILPPIEVALAKIIRFFEGGFEYSTFFETLLEYVERRKKEEPGREFFVTGHSLGGGLAKLVASRAGLRAVTFMAPGLSATSHLIFGDGSGEQPKGDEVLTVQPSYDVVSRIDTQTGLVVPLECSKTDSLYCHLIGPALCEIFSHCGSGREGQTLAVPCGTCSEMPCPGGDGDAVQASAAAWPWPTVSPQGVGSGSSLADMLGPAASGQMPAPTPAPTTATAPAPTVAPTPAPVVPSASGRL